MPSLQKSTSKSLVFDIGGTNFRSGIYSSISGLHLVEQKPAISFRRHPLWTVSRLKAGLVSYLADTARRLAPANGIASASVSLGAALDEGRQIVYGSGPLWGMDTTPFEILPQLSRQLPEISWSILNDITAALFHYVSQVRTFGFRKVMLLTISTGIACRTIDLRKGRIALDAFGLQGEVGHLPVELCHDGHALELVCDCGSKNHLSAFSSGPGLERMATALAQSHPKRWAESIHAHLKSQGLTHEDALTGALEAQDGFAEELLTLATRPVADLLRTALTLDPEIDRIVLTGGVAVNLGKRYHAMLLRHFAQTGLYLSSTLQPDLFEDRIRIAAPGEIDGLVGAGIYSGQDLGRCHG